MSCDCGEQLVFLLFLLLAWIGSGGKRGLGEEEVLDNFP